MVLLKIWLYNSLPMKNLNDSILGTFKQLIDSYSNILSLNLGKTPSKANRDNRKKNILLYTYGLKSKAYSREEISLLLDITVERVRQLQIEVVSEIKEIIKSYLSDTKTSSFPTDFKDLTTLLEAQRVLSLKNFYDLLNSIIHYDLEVDGPYIKLLIDIQGYQIKGNSTHLLRNNEFIFFDKSIDFNDFIRLSYAVYLSVEENIVPIDLNDLIIKVKRKIRHSPISNEIIELSCSQLSEIETIVNQEGKKYQILFHKLPSARDMAYRILFEKGEKMKFAEILKEINHRLVLGNKGPVGKLILSQQQAIDDKFTPMGKTGYWTLTEWGEDNLSMYELITNTLNHFNHPLLKKEIINHIQKSRPYITARSLDTIIYDSRYSQIKGKRFILSEWKSIYKDKLVITKNRNLPIKNDRVKDQIKQQIFQLFQNNGTDEFLLSSIVKTLHLKFKFPIGSIYTIIKECPDFESIENTNKNKVVRIKGELKSKINIPSQTTSVFISYCWENEHYKELVISFVEFLRKNGFLADLDISIMQSETSVDFNRLMHKGILHYDKVIVLLSSNYKIKAEKFEGGVGREYRYIINDIDQKPLKYVFASFELITTSKIKEITPIEFMGREIVGLKKDELNNFELLFSKLTDAKRYIFSDIAQNTPTIIQKKIEKFTLNQD
jgi:hypothetical protein